MRATGHPARVTSHLAQRTHSRVALQTAAEGTLAAVIVVREFREILASLELVVLPVIAIFVAIEVPIPAPVAIAAREAIVAAVLGARRIARLRAVRVARLLAADRRRAILGARRRGTVLRAVFTAATATGVVRIAIVRIETARAVVPRVAPEAVTAPITVLVPPMVILVRIVLVQRIVLAIRLDMTRPAAGMAARDMAIRGMAATAAGTVAGGRGRAGCPHG